MKKLLFANLGLAMALAGVQPVLAQNIEDEPLEDEAPLAAPAPPKDVPQPILQPENPPVVNTGDTVQVPRAVWEQLMRDVEELKKQRGTVPTTPPQTPLAIESATPDDTGAQSSAEKRNYLLLPDISFIFNGQYLGSSDKRDDGRNSFGLEGEIGLQGYVYPDVKFDGFFVASPNEDEAFGIEESYLTFLGVRKGLNVQVGRKFAPFGRTGELHPHSWLYSRQLLARQNLIAGENLVGNGVNLNYLLPTGKNLFARLSLGAFSGAEGADGRVNTSDPSDPFEGSAVSRPGAGFSRFYNARLWMGKSLGEKNEVELGFSHARGAASIDNLTGFDAGGNELVDSPEGRVKLSGVDLSYRRFMGNNKRLLLRAEGFKNEPENLPTRNSRGYYAFANYRYSKFNDVGLLYEKTDFPTAPGLREKALSLIFTKQFSERYFIRLTGTRGDRPGERNLNEVRLQFVAGLGPHTHELE